MSEALLDLSHLEAALPALREEYRRASPFAHIVLEGMLPEASLARVCADFGDSLERAGWTHYEHLNERKRGLTRKEGLGPNLGALVEELSTPEFLSWLERLTGIPGLLADPELAGGGLHVVERGGYLNLHADFTVHPRRTRWRRRLNLLLYLNRDWDESWGGELELWDRDVRRCERRVSPLANRMVLFATDENSFHGHPEPLKCPPERQRRSLALYYFTEQEQPFVRSTEYRARPGEALYGLAVRAETLGLRAYDALRRRYGFDDRVVSRVLGALSRLRRSR